MLGALGFDCRWCKTFYILYFFTQINRSVNLLDKSQLFTPCQKDLAQALLKNAINNLPNHEDKVKMLLDKITRV